MRFDEIGEFEGEVIGDSFEYEPGKTPVVILNIKEATSGNTIYAYLYQFKKNAEVWNKDTQLYGYDQTKDALGWNGLSYDSFGKGTYNGTQLKFETYEDEYRGKISIKVKSVWNGNNDRPSRSLAPVDAAVVQKANSMLRFAAPVAATKAAKPKRAANPTVSSATQSNTTPVNVVTSSVPARNTKQVATPAPCSKTAAWLEVSDPDSNGNADQDAVNAAWTATINAVAGESTADEDITQEQWGQVRTQTIATLLKK